MWLLNIKVTIDRVEKFRQIFFRQIDFFADSPNFNPSKLSSFTVFIIMIVSGLVHLYSIGYMEGDPHGYLLPESLVFSCAKILFLVSLLFVAVQDQSLLTF